ncbi:hypothetical protein ACHHYP_14497 [Achlya hypogyna]|uniref:Uncharacterized protein n=1 Tax=Achlya hypogyna TaxID=1202772 RepID=A0A1V9YD21_ACHHY|nr:hypothetical protein ACHHYP_14497 [Achlya hypogyna]
MTTESKYGNLSMRNIMIRKKLEERKRFDSADYAMAAAKPALAIATDVGAPPAIMSPAHMGMIAFRDGMADADMTLSPAGRQTAVAKDVPSKYGALTARNIILRRKLTDRTIFDSADYQLKKLGVTKDVIGTEQVDVDMTGDDDGDVDMEAKSPRAAKPQTVASAMPTSPSSKYGKLCAANILIRKKLKERKRFDSADYSMERQGKKQASIEDPPNTRPVVHVPAFSPDPDVHSPVTKQMKLTSLATSPRNAAPAAGARDLHSPTNRVAVRNIFLQRKLAERKRFDSGEYFASK